MVTITLCPEADNTSILPIAERRIRNPFHVNWLCRKYGLAPSEARLVARLAGIGGVHD
jgi:hypothetical protein